MAEAFVVSSTSTQAAGGEPAGQAHMTGRTAMLDVLTCEEVMRIVGSFLETTEIMACRLVCKTLTFVASKAILVVDCSDRGNPHFYSPERLVSALERSHRLFPSVETVLLQRNWMQEALAKRVVAGLGLSTLKCLTHLDLSSNSLEDGGVAVFARMLQQGRFPRLSTVILEHNGFGADGVSQLASAARAGCFSELRVLRLAGNQLGRSAVPLLAALQEHCPHLRHLGLSECRIGFASFRTFEEFAWGFPSMEILDLKDCALSTPQGVQLVHCLKSMPRLRQLVLNDNAHCGADVISSLAEAVERGVCTYLECLELEGLGRMSPSIRERWAMLFSALRPTAERSALQPYGGCPRLKKLVLSSNDLGQDSIISLCHTLSHPPTAHPFTHLDLSRVLLAQEGAEAIMSFLRSDACPNLRTFSLANEAQGQTPALIRLFPDLIGRAASSQCLAHRSELILLLPYDFNY